MSQIKGNKIKIGIIDNGVDETFLFSPLQHSVHFTEENGDDYPQKRDGFSYEFKHGTICALIIQQNCPDSRLSSIRILNDRGKGSLDSIAPALEWCLQKEIYLVNVSLGTTHYADRDKLKRLINAYTAKGMFIVAATANNGFVSYPASFSNVIGVAATKPRQNDSVRAAAQKGVDLTAYVSPEIASKKEPLPVMTCNSYATPYITALAGKILLEQPAVAKMSVFTLKQKLIKLCGGRPKGEPYYAPDWMLSAWIDKAERPEESIGSVDGFKIYSGEDQLCRPEIDTLIFYDYDKARHGNYSQTGKNVLYLGDKKIDSAHCPADRFYWDRYRKAEQIIDTEKRQGVLQLPVIVCLAAEPIKLLSVLVQLKTRFKRDGYQIYAVSDLIESVLHNLEYIPVELLHNKPDKLDDFLYWQTYYRQSDAILIGLSAQGEEHLAAYREQADMTVSLNYMEKGVRTEIRCDGKIKKRSDAENLDIDVLYQDIMWLFAEAEDSL